MYLFWIYRTRYFFSITCNCSWSDSNVDLSVLFPTRCKEVTRSFILNTTSKIQIKNKSNPELHKLFASGSIQYFHVQKMIKRSLSPLKKPFIMINYSQQKMFKSLKFISAKWPFPFENSHQMLPSSSTQWCLFTKLASFCKVYFTNAMSDKLWRLSVVSPIRSTGNIGKS